MNPIIFTTTDNIEYTIYWRKPKKRDLEGCKAREADGICMSPDNKNPKILINPKLHSKRVLEILLEECGHAFFWDKNEKMVRKFARVVAQIIITLGWKSPKKGKKKKL